MENTYLLEAPIQATAGQTFNSNKTRVQGMAHARSRCAVPPCVPLPMFYIERICLACAWALQLHAVQYDSLELGLGRQNKRPDSW